MEYKSPHKARYGHIHLGMSKARTAEERKAVSLNVMHGGTGITDEIYMRMNSHQVSGIISGFSFDEPENELPQTAETKNPLLNAFSGLDSDTLLKMSQILASAAASQSNPS